MLRVLLHLNLVLVLVHHLQNLLVVVAQVPQSPLQALLLPVQNLALVPVQVRHSLPAHLLLHLLSHHHLPVPHHLNPVAVVALLALQSPLLVHHLLVQNLVLVLPVHLLSLAVVPVHPARNHLLAHHLVPQSHLLAHHRLALSHPVVHLRPVPLSLVLVAVAHLLKC